MEIKIELEKHGAKLASAPEHKVRLNSEEMHTRFGLASIRFKKIVEKESLPEEAVGFVNFNPETKQIDKVAPNPDSRNEFLVKMFVGIFNDVSKLKIDDVKNEYFQIFNQQRMAIKCDYESWESANQALSNSTVILEFISESMERGSFAAPGMLSFAVGKLIASELLSEEKHERINEKLSAMRSLAESLQDYGHLIDDIEERQQLVQDIMRESGFKSDLEQALIIAMYRHDKEQSTLAQKMHCYDSTQMILAPFFILTEFWAMVWLLTGVTEGLVDADKIRTGGPDAWFSPLCLCYAENPKLKSVGGHTPAAVNKVEVMGLQWPEVPTPLNLTVKWLIQDDIQTSQNE
jgi:hypothetical protein